MKIVGLKKEETVIIEAFLSILIHEFKGALPDVDAVNKVLDSWIVDNNIDMSSIKTMNMVEAKKYLKKHHINVKIEE